MARFEKETEYLREEVRLSQDIGEVDMNNPATVAKAIRLIAEGSLKSSHDIPKSTGLWLKYMAETIEAGLADHKRQGDGVGHPANICMGVINAMAICAGFFALGISRDKDEAKQNKQAFAEVFGKNLQNFSDPEYNDPEVPDVKSDKAILDKFMSDISGGTVH